MFLELLRRRNPAFLDAAIALHQAGEIPGGCYVLDLDAVEANARALRAEADRLGVEIFAMTKQVGRNAPFIAAVGAGGIDRCVCVDMADARAVVAAGAHVGHLGHLVQVPFAEADRAAAMAPDVWTVYSHDKAREAAAAAARAGRRQTLLARIVADGDTFYRNQEGGFDAGDAVAVARAIDALDGARFGGITTFPALLYDAEARDVVPTPNLGTLEGAAAELRAAGFDVIVNGPGTTSVAVMPILAEHGVTQVEPGHGLTGTTALHRVRDLAELPAVAYLSEVSHHHGGQAFVFGSGFYIDPIFPDYQVRALVGRDLASATEVDAELVPPSMIDYHAMLEQPRPLATGETALFGFRPQIFVTRALVAPIAGVASGAPRCAGIYAPDGHQVVWP
jgi:predicted amino acid racemase